MFTEAVNAHSAPSDNHGESICVVTGVGGGMGPPVTSPFLADREAARGVDRHANGVRVAETELLGAGALIGLVGDVAEPCARELAGVVAACVGPVRIAVNNSGHNLSEQTESSVNKRTSVAWPSTFFVCSDGPMPQYHR
jgi:NAD(P)-dependent dehydrogenase (short-subunit alcohol dehydrogenase family)